MSRSLVNRTQILGFIFLFAVILWPYIKGLYLAPIYFDEQYFIQYGYLLMKGWVPYVDFLEPKPPMIFVANALGLKLFGLDHNRFRILSSSLALISIFIFFLGLLREKIKPWIAFGVVLQISYWFLNPAFHDGGLNDTESYGFAYCLLSSGFIFWANSLESSGLFTRLYQNGLRVVAGLCLGFAVLSKELFLFSVIPILIVSAYDLNNARWFCKRWVPIMVGSGVAGLLFLTYLVMTGALNSYFQLLLFYRKFAAHYCVDIGVFPKVPPGESFMISLKKLHSLFYSFRWLCLVLPLIFLAFWKVKNNAMRGMLGLGLIGGAFAVATGNCFWKHYALMGFTGVLLPTLMGARIFGTSKLMETRPYQNGLIVVCGALLVGTTWITWSNRPYYSHPVYDPLISEKILLASIEKYTQPDDPIFTTGNALVYVKTNRLNALPMPAFDAIIDDLLPGATDQEKFQPWRTHLEKTLPRLIHVSQEGLAQRSRMVRGLLWPFIDSHSYVQVQENIWVLPK